MGGCASNRTETLTKYKLAFTEKELHVLDVLYQLLCMHDSTNGYLTHKSMRNIFKENPDLSIKLYNWMKVKSKNGLLDFETFVITLELLLKEQVEYYLSDYKYRVLEKFELFALISLGVVENEKDTINRHQVTYSQGSTVIKELLNMFFFNQEIQNSQKNDLAARSVTNAIFEQKSVLPFNQFIANTKGQLIYANKVTKMYFQRKFLDPSIAYSLPRLDNPSFILNDQILALLQMSSPVFQQIDSLKKVYSSSVNQNDFDHITEIIVNSKQSLMFIFRNREHESQNDSFQQQVFGAYINIDSLIETHYVRKIQKDPKGLLLMPNEEINLYYGDERSFLFSLMPKYQMFMSCFDKNAKRNFAYLNNREFNFQVQQPYGLGFGGDGKGQFRIWISENMKDNNSCLNNHCDQTYEMGFLLEPHIQYLNLTAIEIWEVKVNDEYEEEKEEPEKNQANGEEMIEE